MAKLIPINEGQIVYVTRQSFTGSEPNLSEYIVTKVNGTSFYARKAGSNFDTRFNRKTFVGESTFDHHRAYINPDDYWNGVARIKEKKSLKESLSKSIDSMSLADLRKVNELIQSLTK